MKPCETSCSLRHPWLRGIIHLTFVGLLNSPWAYGTVHQLSDRYHIDGEGLLEKQYKVIVNEEKIVRNVFEKGKTLLATLAKYI